MLDEGRVEHPGATHCTPLTAEGLVGAVFAILHSRLLRERPEPLSELTHDLDAILLLPHLGEAQVSRERSRGGRSGTRTRRPAAAPA